MNDTLLIKRYKVIKVLSSGARTIIRLVADLQNNSTLRVIKSAVSEDASKGIRREYDALKKLSSVPGVVKVYDFYEGETGVHLVLEYLKGKTLESIIKDRKIMTEKETTALVTHISEIISAIHRCGWVHGDVKPGNVMIESDGRISLFDLETASPIGKKSPIHAWTRGYASPEAWLHKQLDERHDYYSLGIILYEMLTGGILFRKDNIMLKEEVLGKNPPAISGISDVLNFTVLRLLAKDRKKRIGSHQELLAVLGHSTCLPVEKKHESNTSDTLSHVIDGFSFSFIYLLISFFLTAFSGRALPFAGYTVIGLLAGIFQAISGYEGNPRSFLLGILYYPILGIYAGVITYVFKAGLSEYAAWALVSAFLMTGVVIWESLEA